MFTLRKQRGEHSKPTRGDGCCAHCSNVRTGRRQYLTARGSRRRQTAGCVSVGDPLPNLKDRHLEADTFYGMGRNVAPDCSVTRTFWQRRKQSWPKNRFLTVSTTLRPTSSLMELPGCSIS